MATKGLATPIVGNYSYDSDMGKVTYSNPTIADHAIEYSVAITTSEDNPLYGDNGIIENDSGTFQSGELTLGTADMPQNLSKNLLGIKIIEKTYGPAGSQLKASEGVYDDDRAAPYKGFGIVEMHQIDNKNIYRAVFLPKVKFAMPEQAATTKGESVEWQTKSITATIMRSDETTNNPEEGYVHPWLIDAWFEKESDAVEWLMYKCGKTASEQAEKAKVKKEQ